MVTGGETVVSIGVELPAGGRGAGHVGTESATEPASESELRLRGIVEQSFDGIALIDEDGLVIEWNPAQARIYGLPRERAIGRLLWDLQAEVALDARRAAVVHDQMKAMLQDFLRTGSAPWLNRPMEWRVRRSDGTERTVQQVTFAIRTERGFRAGSVTRDVTERLDTEQQFQATTETLKALLDSAPIGIIGLDAEGAVRSCNRAAERILGRTADEVVGSPPPYAAVRKRATVHLTTGTRGAGSGEGEEIRHRRPDGSTVYLNLHTAPLLNSQGRLAGYVTSIADVTARKRAEAQVRRSEARFRDVADNMQDGLIITEGTHAVYVNDRAIAITGYSRAQLLSLPLESVAAPEERERILRLLRPGDAAEAGPDQLDFWAVRGDGERRHLQCRFSRHSGSRQVGYILITDATQAKLAEDALRRSEELYRGIAEATLAGIWVLGPRGESLYANQRMSDLIGLPLDTLLDSNLLDFVEGPQCPRTATSLAWVECMEGGPNECLLRRPDGYTVWTLASVTFLRDDDGRSVGALAVFTDISEHKLAEEEHRLLEEQVRRAQKLESLGMLAGGIAHDFNNLLVAILGNADLAMMDLPEDSPVRELVADIRTSSMRAADLSRQMLTYSGRGGMARQRFDVNQAVRRAGQAISALQSRPDVLQLLLADGLPQIQGDPSQVEQVVANLLSNAAEALREAAGAITVSTGLIVASAEYLATLHLGEGLPAGEYVSIEVRDTGCGMDEDTLKRIFDPFFSTKLVGRGLGLPVVHGVVSAHRGAIEVGSAPGAGSTFRVLLPVSPQPAEPDLPAAAPPLGILVIDDEVGIRTIAKRVLEREGYTVLTASDGMEGVDIFRQHADEVALVLLDLTMPRLSGEEACRVLRAIRADVPVLLLSGYSEQTASTSFADLGIAGFIQKPFSRTELCARVEETIRGRQPGRA